MCVCVCVCVVRQSAREAFETKHSNWNCWLTVSWGDSFGRRGTQILCYTFGLQYYSICIIFFVGIPVCGCSIIRWSDFIGGDQIYIRLG
jgi:hypothetical protein